MSSRATLVLGTHNEKKRGELAELLEPLGCQLHSLRDYSSAIEVDETGTTFSENARLKATEQAKNLGCWVLGEDSGICVEALAGEPGVYSARYSGANATDESNNAKLLEALREVPWPKRTAYYVCQMALSDANGEIRAESSGRCYGRIRFQAAGSGGFGYDPLFEIVEYHHTFGELSPIVKSVLSHRARATRKFVIQLSRLLAENAFS